MRHTGNLSHLGSRNEKARPLAVDQNASADDAFQVSTALLCAWKTRT
jgi:hypothetical protein